MANTELNVASLDHEGIKRSLIDFLKTTQFGDFNYEGSAINTMVDLLTRNDAYYAFFANMVANESFLDSAQVRANVSSHSQKLSYIPKTRTATRMICDIQVVPTDTSDLDLSIIMPAGTTFIAAVGGTTYTFVSHIPYALTYDGSTETYNGSNIELFQGQRITNRYVHEQGTKHVILNSQCDSSTIQMRMIQTQETQTIFPYTEATSLDDFGRSSRVWFRGENTQGLTTFEFGRDIFGEEPPNNAIIELTYISTEPVHANGVNTLIAASTIDDFSNIAATVRTPGYGGSDRDDIETIRFTAPKIYQMQDRALTDSDYIPLLKTRFPFIRAGISWGGESNIPPAFGQVFLSILTQDGGLITQGVKQQMVEFVSSRNVGSITPVIVDPELFGIDVHIEFAFDKRYTTLTSGQLSAAIISEVEAYNSTIDTFGQYYNQSTLNSRLKQIPGLESVSISKQVYREFQTLRFPNPVYTFFFGNKIKRGSVHLEDFVIDFTGTNHKIYDRNGIIIASYIVAGQTIETNIGTVDYDKGDIEFSVNFIQSNPMLKLYVEPDQDNYYVRQNKIVSIDQITTSLITIQGR